MAHAAYDKIIETPLTNAVTAREFLTFVSQAERSGVGASLILERQFLQSITCDHCGKVTTYLKPTFRLFQDEVNCPQCGQSVDRNRFLFVDSLSMNSAPELLDLPLETFGIQKLHILTVRNAEDEYQYYELSGDVSRVMPSIFPKEQS